MFQPVTLRPPTQRQTPPKPETSKPPEPTGPSKGKYSDIMWVVNFIYTIKSLLNYF